MLENMEINQKELEKSIFQRKGVWKGDSEERAEHGVQLNTNLHARYRNLFRRFRPNNRECCHTCSALECIWFDRIGISRPPDTFRWCL